MILSIDPGGGTGFATLSRNGHHSWETQGRHLAMQEIEALVTYGEPSWEEADQVIIERFTIGERTTKLTQQQDALRIIGYTEGLCLVHNVPFYESPQSALKWGPKDALKTLGWDRPTKDGHANSASMHLLHWLCTTPGGRVAGGESLLQVLV